MRVTIRLTKLHRWSLYFVWFVISISGVYFAYSQDWQMQEPSEVSVQTLKVHGIFATLMLLIIGSLMTTHVKLSLRRKRNLVTGLVILSVMLILSFSGSGLYYSPEEWHENVKWIHIWVGVISILILPIHIMVGRFLKKKNPKLSKAGVLNK